MLAFEAGIRKRSEEFENHKQGDEIQTNDIKSMVLVSTNIIVYLGLGLTNCPNLHFCLHSVVCVSQRLTDYHTLLL